MSLILDNDYFGEFHPLKLQFEKRESNTKTALSQIDKQTDEMNSFLT